MSDLSAPAMAYGRESARRLLSNRTGHGGAPVVYRQLNEAQLIALLALAYDAGRNSR